MKKVNGFLNGNLGLGILVAVLFPLSTFAAPFESSATTQELSEAFEKALPATPEQIGEGKWAGLCKRVLKGTPYVQDAGFVSVRSPGGLRFNNVISANHSKYVLDDKKPTTYEQRLAVARYATNLRDASQQYFLSGGLAPDHLDISSMNLSDVWQLLKPAATFTGVSIFQNPMLDGGHAVVYSLWDRPQDGANRMELRFVEPGILIARVDSIPLSGYQFPVMDLPKKFASADSDKSTKYCFWLGELN